MNSMIVKLIKPLINKTNIGNTIINEKNVGYLFRTFFSQS